MKEAIFLAHNRERRILGYRFTGRKGEEKQQGSALFFRA
jgi:hypothetical protein